MAWTVELVEEVDEWFMSLDQGTAESVANMIDRLERNGPTLGRPFVDRIKGSKLHNLKELRPGSARILFTFDPQRRAVLLVAGDKSGMWNAWYPTAIKLAEDRYQRWLDGDYDEEMF